MGQFFGGIVIGILLTLAVAAGGAYVFLNPPGSEPAPERTFAPVTAKTSAPDLEAHSANFERSVTEVIEGVHVAIGYGLANVIVVEAPHGLIMFDTLESIPAAEDLLPEIRAIRERTGKNITDIVYTHNHTDHVFGAGVFVGDQSTDVRIWAHEDTADRVHEVVNVLRPVIFRRSMRQFGVYLPEGGLVNAGIGPFLKADHAGRVFYREPTDLIDRDEVRTDLAGEQVIFRKAEGETADQLMIYLPDRKLLLPADNYYHTFPNLYAIRGTPYRDVLKWASSIDAMIGLGAETMIPQHTQPVKGAREIRRRLTDYRDAIQFVHDQTVRLMNKGLTPDDIAEQLKLPPHLATQPHLQPFYGRVDWSARAVFSGKLGWFSGDPADLLPVGKRREAELVVELADGPDNVIRHIENAMQRGEPEWALVLASHLMRLDEPGAGEMRAAALTALGEREVSATGRNYFLTAAAEARGFEIPRLVTNQSPEEVFTGFPIANYMQSLQVRLKAEDVLNIERAFCFDFSEPDTPYTLRIRRGVAILETGLAVDCVGTVRMRTRVFKALASKHATPSAALLAGDMQVDGGLGRFLSFMNHFDPP